MIDLHDIAKKNPEIILRGEFGVVIGDSLIVAPNAKNGKIIILFDTAKQMAAIAHFDSSENVEENVTNILNEMRQLGSEVKDVKCSVMEKEEKTLKEKIHKSFKDQVKNVLEENDNFHEVGHTSWSGNDFCNVVLNGNGDTLIDNSPELMRAALNLLIFTVEGDERLNRAMDPELVTKLKKIQGSVSRDVVNQVLLSSAKVLKQTPSTIIMQVEGQRLDGGTSHEHTH